MPVEIPGPSSVGQIFGALHLDPMSHFGMVKNPTDAFDMIHIISGLSYH
jgi:hypothetical protein